MMVQAILDDHKTQTRRVIKPRYRDDEIGFQVITTIDGKFIRVEKIDENECGIFADGTERYVSQPAYPGDILWVRETWCRLESCAYCMCDNEPPEQNGCYVYRATHGDADGIAWRPSIHMPRDAARLFLKVTDVWAERLQEITAVQALEEGCNSIEQFIDVWESTIKPTNISEDGWAANPWVWVIAFERVDGPVVLPKDG